MSNHPQSVSVFCSALQGFVANPAFDPRHPDAPQEAIAFAYACTVACCHDYSGDILFSDRLLGPRGAAIAKAEGRS